MGVLTSEIVLYYSKVSGGSQSDPNDSIGGAIASNGPTDNTINHVWDDVTGDEAVSGTTEYRILYIQNDSATDSLENTKFWVSQITASTTDEVAIALMAAGKNGTAERLTDETTAPSGGESFTAPTSKATGLSIGTLAAGDNYPICIRRVVDASSPAYDANNYKIKFEGDTSL